MNNYTAASVMQSPAFMVNAILEAATQYAEHYGVNADDVMASISQPNVAAKITDLVQMIAERMADDLNNK